MTSSLFRRCGAAGLLVLAAAASARADFVTVRGDAARAANRVDIAFVGDGYTAADHAAGTYAAHVGDYLDYMFGGGPLAAPFGRYRNFFNVHRVTVTSNQSGVDDPNNGVYRDTALNGSYAWNGSVDRLLYFDTGLANAATDAALAGTGIDVDMRLGVTNSTKYGGAGGQWGVWAGGNGSAQEIGMHELGHSFGRLADEYTYGGTVGYPRYPYAEPPEANVTTNGNTADPNHKWARWMGFDGDDGLGPVGAYEGGRYYEEGIYRPTDNSKMRALGRAFDAVSREQLVLKIYENLDPLDEWTDTAATVTNAALEVLRVDPAVIALEWFVDGALVAGAAADLFDPRDWGFGPGLYKVTVRAFDPFGFDVAGVGLQNQDWWVRTDTDSLEQFVTWNVQIAAVPEPATWALILLAAGGGCAARRRSAAAARL